jgi:hypothetical protein
VTAEDVETQKKGVVLIQYCVGTPLSSRGLIHKLGRLVNCMPVRPVSIHACVGDSAVKAAATIAALLIGATNTVRFRVHSGSDQEVLYDLLTFGIPVHALPISPTGEVSTTQHTEFLQRRQNIENLILNYSTITQPQPQPQQQQDLINSDVEDPLTTTTSSSSPSPSPSFSHFTLCSDIIPAEDERILVSDGNNDMSVVDNNNNNNNNNSINIFGSNIRVFSTKGLSCVNVPGEMDILLGRGKGTQNHKGNLRYRHLIESYRSSYEEMSSKGEKTQFIKEVVRVIYDSGGRFLRQDDIGRWVPIDIDEARDKVSHSFRNQRRLYNKNATTETTHDATTTTAATTAKVLATPIRESSCTRQHYPTTEEERDSKRARSMMVEY